MESRNLTTEQQDDGSEKSIVTHQSITFSGPLPHPAILRQYNDIVPDAAERILVMAESQSHHRQELEKAVIKSNNLKSVLGTIFAFIIGCVGLTVGGYTAVKGQPLFGASVSIAILGSMVWAFIYGTSRNVSEMKEKRENEGKR